MKRELSPAFRRYLMTEGEMTGLEIDSMTPNELFEEVLNLEGIINYAEEIKNFIKNCYGIDLDHYEDYLASDSVKAERDAAIKDISHKCAACRFFEGGACPILAYKDYPEDCEHWEWRGLRKEEEVLDLKEARA